MANTEQNRFELSDTAIRKAVMPEGKGQCFLYDTTVEGLALRMRATGGMSWVYMYRRPGDKGTKQFTIGPFPKFNTKQARDGAKIRAGEVVKDGDPVKAKREARAAKKATVTLGDLVLRNDDDQPGPYERSLLQREVVNAAVAMSALKRDEMTAHLRTDIKLLKRTDITSAMAALTNAKKQGAAQDLRKHYRTFLEWCVNEGLTDHNVLAGYQQPKETRAQRVGKRGRGRSLSDDEIIKVWKASRHHGAFGLLVRTCLLGGPRRSEPAKMLWKKNVLPDRITFDEHWTKMGKHHDIPRTPLIESVLTKAKGFERATGDYVFPSSKTGGEIKGWTKLVKALIRDAGTAKWTMHDTRRTLRTIMSRCGYPDDIQRICVGQRSKKLDELYNKDERWIIRKMAFDAAHDYIAELVGEARDKKVVRLHRDPVKTALLQRLAEAAAA